MVITIKFLPALIVVSGLCKENIKKTDEDKLSQALDCYIESVRVAIKYVEELEKVIYTDLDKSKLISLILFFKIKANMNRPQQESISKLFTDLMKVSFERAPLLHIKQRYYLSILVKISNFASDLTLQ